jgi:hypothetical protein
MKEDGEHTKGRAWDWRRARTVLKPNSRGRVRAGGQMGNELSRTETNQSLERGS